MVQKGFAERKEGPLTWSTRNKGSLERGGMTGFKKRKARQKGPVLAQPRRGKAFPKSLNSRGEEVEKLLEREFSLFPPLEPRKETRKGGIKGSFGGLLPLRQSSGTFLGKDNLLAP